MTPVRVLTRYRSDWRSVRSRAVTITSSDPRAHAIVLTDHGRWNRRWKKRIPDPSRLKETLPAYCRVFDVGIIPFRIEDLTLKANPLKLREYLAAGLPVVSSDLPEVRKYGDLVHVAAGADGFVAAIERALEDRSGVAAAARVQAMKHESWDARVEEISELIEAGARR